MSSISIVECFNRIYRLNNSVCYTYLSNDDPSLIYVYIYERTELNIYVPFRFKSKKVKVVNKYTYRV